jgi:hypothetical protein
MRAIEKERKRLLAEEADERERKMDEERQNRKDEERDFVEKIRQRKLEDEERERMATEEATAQRLRDQEEVKRLMMENMKRKLTAEDRQREELEMAERSKPKRKSLANNPLLQRFEEINQQAQAKEEALKAARLANAKKKVWKRKSKEVLRMSRLMLAQALSKERLATPEGRNIVKAVSKEILRIISKESLHRTSNSSLRRSKDRLSGSKDVIRTKSKCNISKENLMSHGNQVTALTDQPSKNDMQNYLISHVLFDGKEDVQSAPQNGTRNISRQQLTNLEEEAQEDEEDREDRVFELYKQEMNKYLECFEQDSKGGKKKKSSKKVTKSADSSAEKKLLVNIGSIKNQFETMASPDTQEEEPILMSKRVGKLNTKAIFAEQEKEKEEEEKARLKKKKEYIPVIIDRDAFERTVGKFAQKDPEETQVPIKRETKVWQPPGMKRQDSIQTSEPDYDDEYEEEEKEEEEEEPPAEDEPEAEPEQEPEPEPEPEPELTEEERVKKMDIFTRIQYELDKVRKREAEQAKVNERENKKKELARQIQEQIAQIKAMDETPKKKKEEDEVPTWVKIVQDPEARKRYRKFRTLDEPTETQEIVDDNNQSKEPEVDNTPQWIKIIRERQAQLKKFEVEFKQREAEAEKKRIESASNEEKSAPKEEVSRLIEKKPDNVIVKSFSMMKDQFESQSKEDQASPRSPTKVISPYEINPERVKMIKEQLLQIRDKQDISKSKAEKSENFIAKKCSTIRNKLEKAISDSNDKWKKDKIKAPKKIINIVEERSVTQLLKEKKQKNAKDSWSYKQKDVKDLLMLLKTNDGVSKTLTEKAKTVAEQSTEVIDKGMELINLQEKIESKKVDEYTELMEQVHTYMTTGTSLSPEEQAFRNTIQGYMELIEDDEKIVTKKTKKSKATANIEVIPTRSIQAIKLEMEQSSSEPTRHQHTVGKLSMTRAEQHAEHSTNVKTNSDMGKGYTSSIREQLIKANQAPEAGAKLTHMMKLVHLEHPKSVTESLRELKAQRIYEWKWRQKNINNLTAFLNQNKNIAQIEVPKIDTLHQKQGMENISYDVKVEDYSKLMDNIREYLMSDDKKSEEENIFQESLCGYLDLIEVDTGTEDKKKLNFDWGTIGNVKDISTHLETPDKAEESKEISAVGKLDTARFEKSKSSDNEKPPTVVRTSTYHCDSIKSYLEKNVSRQNAKPEGHFTRTMKIVNVPEVESYEQALNVLKSRRQEEWKWKQKTISELHAFLKKNDLGDKIAQDVDLIGTKYESDSELMTLKDKSEQLARSIQERDKSMKAFMEDLQDFSDKPSDNTDQVVFKESIKAFLDLIEDDKDVKSTVKALPSIRSPFKLVNKKEKYLEGTKEDSSYPKSQSTKKIGKMAASTLFSTKSYNTTEKKPQQSTVVTPEKASKIKKMFESSNKSSMSRTMSELSLKPQKRPKTIIDVNPKAVQIEAMPTFKRRNVAKWESSIPPYFCTPKSDTMSKKEEPKSKWDDISDPMERHRAILAKHGFKPHEAKEYDNDDPLTDVDTIPDHILKDEILYKKYMQDNIEIEDLSSRESTPDRVRDSKQGSFSSLMNILTAVKKATMQKHAIDSRQRLDMIALGANGNKMSTSAQDLSQIPGSCSNLREQFEMQEERPMMPLLPGKKNVLKSPSCSNIGNLWTDHINSSDNSSANHDRSVVKSGIVSNLKDHLTTSTSRHEQQMRTLNDPARRQSLSHLDLDEDNVNNDKYGSQSEIRLELDALRSSGQTSSIFKLDRGRNMNKPSLRRALNNVEMDGSKDRLDLDDDDMAQLRTSNQQVKAMFEASAPKYTFGGSGDKLNLQPAKKSSGILNV